MPAVSRTDARLAPLVALVGCDGSGKSTVAAALIARIGAFRPAEAAHLGSQSGAVGRRLARVPLVGGLLDRTVEGRAGRARRGESDPDALTAAVMLLFSLRRAARFRRMLARRRRGIAVVADRFPLAGAPGFLDGPALGRIAATRGPLAVLRRREAALYAWMARFPPDLVIRLDVDLETALARKPDHRPDSLRRKVAAVRRLDLGGLPVVELSALRPLDEVVEAATAAVAARLGLPPAPAGRALPDGGTDARRAP